MIPLMISVTTPGMITTGDARSARSSGALQLRFVLLTLLALVVPWSGSAAEEVRPLRWPELIPASLAGAPVAPPSVDHFGDTPDLTQLSPWGDLEMSALLVPELDGEQITISGFVVPLNLTRDNRVDEFLLVPYFGACVHVPPPPPNQVIYVTSDEGLDAQRIYEAWTVTGTLRVEARRSAMADAGYSLAAAGIRLYGT